MTDKKPEKPKKATTILPERIIRRMLEGVGEVVDKKLGRTVDLKSGVTTSMLVAQARKEITNGLREEGRKGKIAPHSLKLKVEWGTFSEASPETIEDVEHEILAAAIDFVNDNRYRTLAPLEITSEADIFAEGMAVTATFGEFAEELALEDLKKAGGAPRPATLNLEPPKPDRHVKARARLPGGPAEFDLVFQPGGRRLSVGRGKDNDLRIQDGSVSKTHAALVMNKGGELLVADTGSTNGTSVNGQRLAYGAAQKIQNGDLVGFGFIEVRFHQPE
ncbi:MAG: FHA domain-containing protein [Pyrinomonadaceae bacterium]